MIKHQYFCIVLIFLSILRQTKQQNDIVSNIVNEIPQEKNITCLCMGDEKCDKYTNTCRLTNADHSCYQSWTKHLGEPDIELTAGCVRMDFLWTMLFCNNNQTNRYIICCSDKDLCNDRDAYSNDIRKELIFIGNLEDERIKNEFLFSKDLPKKQNKKKFILFIIGFLSLLVGLIFFFLLIFHFIRKRSVSSDTVQLNQTKSFFERLCHRSITSLPEKNKDEISKSSSADDLAGEHSILLEPRTFTRQIKLEERIGVGGYGAVYRGRWYDKTIAVKIFLSTEEASWSREVEIYKTPGLNHENILRYIAADNIDISCRIELWLATEYHENGSLYDYLINHTINPQILSRMVYSIAEGLWHLHVPIDATNGRVAFAHRDIKTKNILVKQDLSCCIADLGLAVKEVREREHNNNNNERVVIDIKPNHRVGTIRYMAPEILDRTLNHQSFASYKAADIYALGLVFWEILRRCRLNIDDEVDSYEQPYEDVLPNNPSFESMHEIVCVQKHRPKLSTRWRTNSFTEYLSNLSQEMWSETPSFRPDIFHIFHQLQQRIELIDNDRINSTIESRIEHPQTV